MTVRKKLAELGILLIVWVPVAVLAAFAVYHGDDIAGKDNAVYALLAALVLVAWVGTEYALEALRVDTSDPTWYGYIVPVDTDLRVLPGRYRLCLEVGEVAILIRRPCRMGAELCFPFWGLDAPPNLPDAVPFALEPDWSSDEPGQGGVPP